MIESQRKLKISKIKFKFLAIFFSKATLLVRGKRDLNKYTVSKRSRRKCNIEYLE